MISRSRLALIALQSMMNSQLKDPLASALGANTLPQPMPIAPNRFKTVSLLRTGDLATVILATDCQTQATLRSLQVRVALAHIPHIDLGPSAALVTLRASLLKLSQVNHRNILKVYETFSEDKTEIVSLENVDGAPLSALLGRASPSVADSISILLDICAGLTELYRLGFKPFGLSPQNIVISSDGSAKIDPLSAALLDTTTRSDFKSIPANFLAPESERHIAAQNDVYALGVIAKELLRGSQLVRDSFPKAKFINSLWEITRTKVQHRSLPSNLLLETLEKARALDTSRRFATIEELRYELCHIQEQFSAQVQQPERTSNWVVSKKTVLRPFKQGTLKQTKSRIDPFTRTNWALALLAIYVVCIVSTLAFYSDVIGNEIISKGMHHFGAIQNQILTD